MKGKRYTTADKIRIPRDGDRGKRILEVCQAHHLSEASFHRWKRQFGQMDLSTRRTSSRRSNARAANSRRCSPQPCSRTASWKPSPRKKLGGPAHRRQAAHAVGARGRCSGRAACRIRLLSRAPFRYQPAPPTCSPATAGQAGAASIHATATGASRRGDARKAGLVGKRHIQRPAPCRRSARAADQTQARALWGLHRAAHQSWPSWPRVDLGLPSARPRCVADHSRCSPSLDAHTQGVPRASTRARLAGRRRARLVGASRPETQCAHVPAP